MLINLFELKNQTHHSFKEELHFSNEQIKSIDLLKEIKSLIAFVDLEICEPFIIAKIKLQGELILFSSRSLKDVPYKIKDEETITFALNKIDETEDEDNIIVIKGNEIDFNEYFLSLLEANIPFKVLAENEQESLSGESWELISEEEYYNRKKTEANPLFDELKDFEE